MFLNAAKYQGYSFYRFWVINGKPAGWIVSPIQIRSTVDEDSKYELVLKSDDVK